MKRLFLFLLLINLLNSPASSNCLDEVPARKKYVTTSLTGAITLDGIPDDDAWKAVEWGGDFIQSQPHEGKAPSQPTGFKILYDEKFLYIAYDCHDLAPDSIIQRMGRRDEFPGDWVEVNIDSYH